MSKGRLIAAVVVSLTVAAGALAQQAAPPPDQQGVQVLADPSTLKLAVYPGDKSDLLASEFIGTGVNNLAGENIGTVQDLVIERGGGVKAIVITVGGLLGVGGREIAVTPGSVAITQSQNGELSMIINATSEDIRKLPVYGDPQTSAGSTPGQKP